MTKYFVKDGEDFKETEAFSQEQVDSIVEKRLERVRNQYTDYNDLKTKAESVEPLKQEYDQKLEEAKTEKLELEKKLKSAQLDTKRVKIVNEFKLTEDLAEFVSGDTEDEMRTRAEKLAKGMKPGKVAITKQKKPEGGGDTDSKTIANNLFGKKSGD